MKSGNLRKLYIIYWEHPTMDWRNQYTKELTEELTYNEKLNLRFRYDLDYRLLNCHRQSEDYVRNRELVEYLRPQKTRREILVYMELWKSINGSKEETVSLDSEYRLKLSVRRIWQHLEEQY